MLIALSSLVLALLIVNDPAWPARSYRQTANIAVILGIAVTLFSEWFNTTVAATWAYSDLMPVVPGLEVGLSPIAQWVAIPAAGLSWARRGLRRASRRQEG
jgi:hypothetical protein